MTNNKNIGSRETATITYELQPTWGTEQEICKWHYQTEDGIQVKLTSRGMYVGDQNAKLSMEVMHTNEKGWNTGGYGCTQSLPSAKRWITRMIRETRETLARRADALIA
jgi:hypothetical protein